MPMFRIDEFTGKAAAIDFQPGSDRAGHPEFLRAS